MKPMALMIVSGLGFGAGVALASPGSQEMDKQVAGADLSETALVEKINHLAASVRNDLPLHARLQASGATYRAIVRHVDVLLSRYPKSAHREAALLAKVEALAELARAQPQFLEQFLSVTNEIAVGNPQGRLASENAYFAIQAFVLGARNENMPSERRLRGTIERYQAFLANHPTSPRRPVIWASLIRSLIAAERVPQAKAQLAKFQAQFPRHQATRRAAGEVRRAAAVGKPFQMVFSEPGGRTIRTADYAGQVLIVHFWSSWSKEALEQVATLRGLHADFGSRGLQLLGINLDQDRTEFEESIDVLKLPWPQHFAPDGFRNELLIDNGVVRIPSCFVIDCKGVLRYAGYDPDLRRMIEGLLGECAK